MALLDVFKKKKTSKKEKKLAPSKVEGKEDISKIAEAEEKKGEEEKKPTAVAKKVEKKDFSYAAFKVLKSPHVTEKAVNLGVQNKYVFKVAPETNKVEVKKAIQELYGVKVADVNIINIARKRRRLGRSEGFKAGYKKAIVTVKEGEKIETGV